MNYIVLDLEWNQSSTKENSVKGMPFEIIEIGAVKLDENRKMIDTYSQVIRPKIYPQIHFKAKELTGITQCELNEGIDFEDAAMDFLFWCGEEYVFCTWGNLDLTEFQRNLTRYKMIDFLPGPIKYYNIQKFFKLFFSKEKQTSSLDYAAAYFNIEDCGHFHRALNDAKYTAEIFNHVDIEKAEKNYTIDYFQYPRWKDEEIHLTYDEYYKYISRGFVSREEALYDREVRAVRCYRCGEIANKKIRWFTSKSKNYYCLAHCKQHGYLRGKIKIKHMDDGRFVAVKTIRPANSHIVEDIYRIKKEVIAKRREKRHKGCDHE